MSDAELLEKMAMAEDVAAAEFDARRGDTCAEIAREYHARAAQLRAIAARLAAPPPADFEAIVEAMAVASAREHREPVDNAFRSEARRMLTAAGVPALLAERYRLREACQFARKVLAKNVGQSVKLSGGEFYTAAQREMLDAMLDCDGALANPPQT